MKSKNDMVFKAVDIAESDPAARVLFFCNSIFKAYVKQLLRDYSLSPFGGGVWKEAAEIYIADGGGEIRLCRAIKDTNDDFSGRQFTHVFYREDNLNFEYDLVLKFIRSRIGTKDYKGEAPMGMYNEWFASICVNY